MDIVVVVVVCHSLRLASQYYNIVVITTALATINMYILTCVWQFLLTLTLCRAWLGVWRYILSLTSSHQYCCQFSVYVFSQVQHLEYLNNYCIWLLPPPMSVAIRSSPTLLPVDMAGHPYQKLVCCKPNLGRQPTLIHVFGSLCCALA